MITAFAVAAFMQMNVSGATEVSPAQEAEAFMAGMTAQQEETLDRYMANDYVNFRANVEGDEKITKEMRDALFKNLTYEIKGTRQRKGLAVAKVEIKGNDFSKVLKAYEKDAYDYITENLYEDEVTDKGSLNARCLAIYADEVEKAADKGKIMERTIYLPMAADGHNGWTILLNDEIMVSLLGDLALPGDLPGAKRISFI